MEPRFKIGDRVRDLCGEWHDERIGTVDWSDHSQAIDLYTVAWDDGDAKDVIWFEEDMELADE